MKKNVHHKKAQVRCFDGTTPPSGFKADGNGKAVVNNDLGSALYVQVREVASYV